MSTEATLTSKGQITIPKEVRDRLHMKEGDRMTFTLLGDGTVLIRVQNKSAREIAARLLTPKAILTRAASAEEKA